MERRVVIVGGGAGGVELASTLGRRSRRLNMQVSLVDCASRHLWKPRLHEVAVGLRGDGDAVPYLALAQANGFRFNLGALTGMDAKAQTISLGPVATSQGDTLLSERVLQYDTLVLAFGSDVNDFGTPGVREYCLMLDDSERALGFQRQLLEAAVLVSQGTVERLRIGIVGAGATGVELAAELCHSISAMHRSGGLMLTDKFDITLIDMAPRVLANSAPAVSGFAAHALQRLGVTLRLNSGVAMVTANGFVLKGGDVVPCDLKIWASGVIGRPVAANLNLTLDRSRRIVCDQFLRCTGAENIYALGDCASVSDPATNRPLPTTAQVAHQQAAYLLKSLSLKPADMPSKPYQYRDRGSLVSLGTEPTTGEVPIHKQKAWTFNGIFAKFAYVSLQIMHRATLLGWPRAVTLMLADCLRRTVAPPVKLH
ncbi:NAD(P)/FAD-dependent oxidoreductase [Burkholderia sp. LMG 21824]|uniref:NAD(P)/FAD-dependent oxidoreductase n=1 Tax=Burkholderia sp. LMG 21824 TaxID=3158172 RepID=UPI003C2FBB76